MAKIFIPRTWQKIAPRELLGRPVLAASQTRHLGTANQGFSGVCTAYDAASRPVRMSEPFFLSSIASASEPTSFASNVCTTARQWNITTYFANGAVTGAFSRAFNDELHGAERRAAERRLATANARMLMSGGMRPFGNADEAATFWHNMIGGLPGNVEFGSYIFRLGGSFYLGPVGSSFETGSMGWHAFGSENPGFGMVPVGLIHSHPNSPRFSGNETFVTSNFSGSEVRYSSGRAGDLSIAWASNYSNIYASHSSGLNGWSRSLFLSRFDGAMSTTGRAHLNIGTYCVVGTCE